MMLRAKSPLRISFVGGGTDLPSYYEKKGGAVLSSTINKFTYATLAPRSDGEVSLGSLDFDLTVKYHLAERPIFDGTLDLLKAAVARLCKPDEVKEGFDLYVESDAPAGSGLGGSSSLTTAVVGTLLDLTRQRLSDYEIAETVFQIEREDLAITGGKQDMYAAVFGGFNLIEFSKEKIVVNPLRIDRRVLNDLEYHLMLCYTGRTRVSAGLVAKQEANFLEGREETVDGMAFLHNHVYEMRDALLHGRIGDFAEGLHVSWQNKLRMNPNVTDGKINELYELARKAGAVGGKLLGAGGGGYLLLFCPIPAQRLVREKLEAVGGQFTDFAFDKAGLQTWQSDCP